MLTQTNNTNFGKIGQHGGKVLGRSKKSSRRMAEACFEKFDNGVKSQIKQNYNSHVRGEAFDDICESFIEKNKLNQDKFVSVKS